MKFRILLLFFLLCSTSGRAAVLAVPGSYRTIQSAIDAAHTGDTVLVADGTYTGEFNKDLDLYGKAITVESENGPVNCIIDCEADGRGFNINKRETSSTIIRGFTIRNGIIACLT